MEKTVTKAQMEEYRARWQMVNEFQVIERQAATVEQRWRKFNSIIRMARELGLKKSENKDELEAVQKLKQLKKTKTQKNNQESN